jgi:hypothetical protein
MKNTIKILSIGLLISQILLSSCKGPAGDPGPAGKDGTNGQNGTIGAQGIAGVVGVKGDKGDKGETGSTIISTDWITPNYTVFAKSILQSGNQYYNQSATILEPRITQSVLEKGFFLSYGYIPNQGVGNIKEVVQLPIINVNNYSSTLTALVTSLTPFYRIGQIRLDVWGFSAGSALPLYLIKTIIILPSPGGRLPAIDYSDYNAVKKYYNLKD